MDLLIDGARNERPTNDLSDEHMTIGKLNGSILRIGIADFLGICR